MSLFGICVCCVASGIPRIGEFIADAEKKY